MTRGPTRGPRGFADVQRGMEHVFNLPVHKKIIQCDDDGCYMVYADKWTDLEGNPSNDCIKCGICNKVLLRF